MPMPTRQELISVANYYFKKLNQPKIKSTSLDEVRQIYIENNINYNIVSEEFENKLIENIKKTADEDHLAKIESEQAEQVLQKRYARLFTLRKNGCNKFMDEIQLTPRRKNINNIEVRKYLDKPSKVIILPKIKSLVI